MEMEKQRQNKGKREKKGGMRGDGDKRQMENS